VAEVQILSPRPILSINYSHIDPLSNSVGVDFVAAQASQIDKWTRHKDGGYDSYFRKEDDTDYQSRRE
jgi:hypothetical protein